MKKLGSNYNGVTVEIVEITPEDAAAMLAASPIHNRTWVHRNLKRLLKAMELDAFQFNGESIIMDEGDGIIDGHHRLKCCVDSGKTIVSVLVRGVPRKAMSTVDTAGVRTPGHALGMAGIVNSTAIAALAKLVWSYERGRFLEASRGDVQDLTHDVLVPFVNSRPEFQTAVNQGAVYYSRFKVIQPATWAFFSWLANEKRPEMKWFLERLSTGEGLNASDPELALRNRLIADELAKAHLPRVDKMALTIIAWNYAVKGKPAKLLRWASSGEKPQPFPTIELGVNA